MSNPGDTDLGISSLSADVGWRGKRKSRQLAVSRGWQQGAQPQPLTQVTSQNRRRRVQIAVSFCALLVLFGLWLYMLLFTAVQTPVVAVTATEYDWPLPPNAWAREDLLGLNDLQRRTLRVEEASADWTSRDHALRDFERKVQAQARRQSGLSTLIIFVSMHGLVNDADEPCLVPPGASPVDQSSWLPVRELLDRIKEQAPSEQLTKLLILDCNRIPVNWHVGILENQFADKLAKAVEDASVPRLIVLNSTSPGQTGWASSDLHGSVFGHYLRQALAGEADADGNHRISVGELQAYLRRHVNQWALANRAERQEPMLLAKDELRRHEVVWVAQGKLPPPEAVDPQVTAEDLRQLWLDHDALHDLQPERFAPLAWSALEHRLLWLEQLRDGGRAYGEKAVDVRDDLRRRIATIKKRAEAASGLGSAARSRIWSADDDRAPERGQLHTLPLAEFFGTTDRVVNSKIRDQWNRFQKTPEAGILSDAIAQLDRLAADYRAPALAESSFLRTIQRFALPPQSSPSAARLACVSSVWATVQQGEQAAVPDDERAGSWIRPLVDDGDRHRRAAEDALLDGDDQQLSAEVRLAEEKYTKAQLLAKLVSDAFQLHDEVRLQLPYLAQWLTRPVPLGLASATADREIKERLPRLIDNVHRLSKQLARHDLAGTLEASESAPFAKAESDVRQDFDALGQAFRTNCESLEKGREIAPHQLREVAAVLATPLVDAAQRTKLQRKLADLDLRLNQTTAARVAPEGLHPPSAAEGSKTGETPSVEEARFRYGTASHPALELLRSDWLDEPSAAAPRAAEPKGQDGGAGESTETGGPGGTPVRAVGKRLPLVTDVKRRLQQRLAQLAPLVDSLAVAADANGPVASALEAAWLRRSRAERLVRAASSIWCPPFDSDPVAELRRFDWQQQLLWQCRRTLEDFRGPAARGEEPFFSVAAADYLSPSRLFQAADPVIGQQREALAESLATLRTAARRGLAVAAENVLLIDPADAWQSKVIVTPGAGLAASDLPRGRMAFMVLSGARRVEGVALVSRTPAAKAGDSSMTLLFPLPARQELELQGRAVTQQEPGLLAAAVFRGHEFATPFLVQTLGGLSVDYVPGAEQPPRVTLKGIRRPRKSIVFVLDCSESMKEEVPVEATEGQKVPRLEIAKSALQGMLEQLAAQGEARVGVRLFGHRVGWSTTEPIRALRQTTYARPIPPGLSPAEDVELILPLGRFDSVIAGQVAELLQSVKPWGQTPLYRSLVEALHDFDSDEPGTDQHIVII
ncbi:MAG: VWA domain-containing protein, partial [Planctomycetota bacterium]|nr:VWA domain-containing protein [Planctomycetota bacterium]